MQQHKIMVSSSDGARSLRTLTVSRGFRGSALANLLSAVVILAFSRSACAQNNSRGFFLGLGDLPGGPFFSRAWDISADSLYVVGDSDSRNGREAFRWYKPTRLMEGLGSLNRDHFHSEARAVSGNGSVVVGFSTSRVRGDFADTEAFRWEDPGPMVGLGFLSLPDLHLGSLRSEAWGVSEDGNVVVGWSISREDPQQAFCWTQDTGMVGLNHTPSCAYDISPEGRFVVGWATSGCIEAFRLDRENNTMLWLGDLPGGACHSEARGVSADGAVVVGWSESANGHEAFRWSQPTGIEGLGDLEGGYFWSEAWDVSADGRAIVGYSKNAQGEKAVIWYPCRRIHTVEDWLRAHGVYVPQGWSLTQATGVTTNNDENGRYIITVVGWGLNPAGLTEAWIGEVIACPPGDVNGDGVVDDNDLLMILFALGRSGPNLPEDINCDGVVDDSDLLIVLFNLGATC